MENELELGAAKTRKDDERSLWDRLQTANDYPLSVVLSLTDRCPFSCPHCYIIERDATGELTTEEVFYLIGELAQLGTIRLTLTGGEPGLRSDLLPIITEAKRLHFAVVLKTSATLFDRHDVEALRSAGLSELHVSIYHPDAEMHDRFIGLDGAWRKGVDALDRFHDIGGVPRANAVLMSWNADAISRFVDLCEEHRWTFAVDPRLVVRHGADSSVIELRARCDAIVFVMADPRLVTQVDFEKNAETPICGAGHSAAFISPRGEVASCPDLSLFWGNIREQSFAQIWKTSPVRRRLREVLRWGRSPECLDCRHVRYCTRCPGDAYLEHGNLEAPASFDCMLAEAIGRTRR